MPNSAAAIPLIELSRPPVSFNQVAFRDALSETDSPVRLFKTAIEVINHHLDLRYREGENIRSLVYDRALLTDCLLHFIWHQYEWSDNISLIAVGGYGRGELHPQSDIDILILLNDDKESGDYESTQEFLMFLWDIGLNIGHSVRTMEECLNIAEEDVTVVTNLMETRLLQGSKPLFKALQKQTTPEIIWPNEQFYLAKKEEQDNRHAKYNDTEYNLEPNIKNAPGGLRDIQTIQWVAKRYYNVTTLRALEGKGFFTEAEFFTLTHGEEFLWKVRYGLHMLAKRPEERLLFDHQKELAKMLGYTDSKGQLAVENFMHDYYRIVITLRELNDVLLQYLDEVIVNRTTDNITLINERFQLRDNDIEVVHDKVFEQTPSALLEIFVLAARNKQIVGIRAQTIRLIRENRDLVDKAFREDPINNRLFMALLGSPYKLVTQLHRMKRYGILGRYLPEFDHIIGQMQHDLFHIYTVDAHTLNVIEFMRRFMLPSAEDKFHNIAKIARHLPKKDLLYITGLYHDIAKGRGGDHSELGAVDAIKFCQQHRLSRRDTHQISWLVENHLMMSSTSQKKDLSDPDVIHEFATLVGDQLHLDYLYVLTVADMNATNPDIWNNWRASLLQQLYNETRRALRRGLENPIDRIDRIAETQEQAMKLLKNSSSFSEQAIWELWQTAGDDYFLRENAADIAWHTKAILNSNDPESPLILIADNTLMGDLKVTQIFIRAKLRNNVFTATTSTLDQLHLNIQDARIYSTVSGYTMDTFYVLDSNDMPVSNTPEIQQNIIIQLKKELSISEGYSEIIRRRTPRQLKHFSAPTRTSIFNDINQEYTVLEVVSPDRPGFLARIARILMEMNIEVVTAKITTLGERVEDVFFITDEHGERLSDPTLCQNLQKEIEQQLDASSTDNHIAYT